MSTAIHPRFAGLDVWAPCGFCWGQRRIFEDRNGEGLVPHVCPECLGVGERLSGGPRA